MCTAIVSLGFLEAAALAIVEIQVIDAIKEFSILLDDNEQSCKGAAMMPWRDQVCCCCWKSHTYKCWFAGHHESQHKLEAPCIVPCHMVQTCCTVQLAYVTREQIHTILKICFFEALYKAPAKTG